jgi:RNA polymerase sigma-70 factor (ECF subfamily)
VDDRSIVDAVAAGDPHAFRILVERESPAVFRTCYRILGRIHDAEDATQESFVIAYRALGTFRGDGPLGAWLARIATRHALRRASQRRDLTSLDPLASVGMEPRSDADPLADALSAERQHAVRAAVAQLPDRYREVVALRYFADLSLAEIATSTDRPIGTVKTHLHRGLARLRVLLDGAGS